jgi:hypothetical protein
MGAVRNKTVATVKRKAMLFESNVAFITFPLKKPKTRKRASGAYR